MKPKTVFFFLLLFSSVPNVFPQQKKAYKIVTIAFYNMENLFDTINDPKTFDDDRTPTGKDHWTAKIYWDKLKNMAFAMSRIGFDKTRHLPAIIGLCEVENEKVLEDLLQQPDLSQVNYGIVHFNSPDSRGIDVGLLFDKSIFKVKNAVSRRLLITEIDDPGKRDYTRDQLVVSGFLDGEEIHFIVNHWPSRYGGASASSYKRNAAAALNGEIIDSLQLIDPYAKIITMGDFNDDYYNESLQQILRAKTEKENVKLKDLYNPMAEIAQTGIGSSAYRDSWNLFDQIILSKPLIEGDYSTYKFYKAGIFNENFLITPSGRYRGYPFRSFGFGGYTGGYSDHFPVYVYLIKEVGSQAPSPLQLPQRGKPPLTPPKVEAPSNSPQGGG